MTSVPFVVMFAEGGPLTVLAATLIDGVVIVGGMAIGRRALMAEQAHAAATKSIRCATSLRQIAVALADFVGGTARAVLLVDDGERWHAAADSRGEGLELDLSAFTVGELEGDGRMLASGKHGALEHAPALCVHLLSDSGSMGVLLVAARPARRLRARRRVLAQSLAAQVSLAWHRLQLMEEAQRAALARERERVSHEIHDTLAQDLISAIMHLETAEQQLMSGRGDAAASMQKSEAIVRRCLSQARDLVWSSWRSRAAGPGIAASLQHGIERWSQDNDIAVRCRTVGDEFELSSGAESLLLSTAREALANVRKHAGAREVNVTLSYINRMVALDVQDDGVGFDPKAEVGGDGGFGLAALRERAVRLGGQLVVESSIGEGTVLSVQIPRQESGP
jgi:signal transduction histidine kinase